MDERAPLRVAGGQGFWGDDPEAPVRQLQRGPIDYLVMDYLAEVTMSIMQKQRSGDPSAGYARDFVDLMSRILPECLAKGVKVVANAGGVSPRGCVESLLAAVENRGPPRRARVGIVEGDDVLHRLPSLVDDGRTLANMDTGEPITSILDDVAAANVYLGGRPIVEALRRGADVVVTGRCVDAALTYAPMIHELGWAWDAHDLIAAGVVAGHINECGAQCTGGNCLADWWTIPDLADVGFPIIEARSDGSFVVTKHQGTGGRVTSATVSEQIVYEIGDPSAYPTPDAVADFTSVRLEETGQDRVQVSGARGHRPPDYLKVSVAYSRGWRAVGTLTYAWPDAAAKARSASRILLERLDRAGLRFDAVRSELVGWDSTHGILVGEPPPDIPEVQLRVGVRSSQRSAVERFTRQIAPLVLAGPPSVTGFAGGRPKVQEVMAFWPALLPRDAVEPFVRVRVVEIGS